MIDLSATDAKNLVKSVKKNWLFVQEINAVPASGSGWNEDYQPANKFLYFSEIVAADNKLTPVSSLN
ncbi:hypothetical protein HUW51_23825 [Adhaeribacter swui]|uniref:Uncharacterized protein n=1 Tax=Adhaeribacter swui TaxID=2086471 RepID=A0A7G7GEK3_9BACT|nr:hypothetical protein [Adhaeribacter swui]QNF35587.1 hypothetical protein HUW51_23825 [Adhaeribacter swui]